MEYNMFVKLTLTTCKIDIHTLQKLNYEKHTVKIENINNI